MSKITPLADAQLTPSDTLKIELVDPTQPRPW